MVCKLPFMKDGIAHGCGQCLPCRINRRRLWTHRILLESYSHDANSFATLTYSDEEIPPDLGLKPKDAQDFMKRLRKRISPQKVRFYLVGEYGEKTHRPHYHLALFGYPSCIYGRPENNGYSSECNCQNCTVIQEAWNKGFTHLGELNKDTAAYVAQYVTKAMTNKYDERLQGRYPEFCRMSNRPGIGATAIPALSKLLTNEFVEQKMILDGDVPNVLKHGGKSYPLGRYLKSKLRLSIGKEAECPDHVLLKLMNDRKDLIFTLFETGQYSHGEAMQILNNKQQILNLETKFQIYSKENKL